MNNRLKFKATFTKKDYHKGSFKLDVTDKYKRDTFTSSVFFLGVWCCKKEVYICLECPAVHKINMSGVRATRSSLQRS
jgi:hypothetical protein